MDLVRWAERHPSLVRVVDAITVLDGLLRPLLDVGGGGFRGRGADAAQRLDLPVPVAVALLAARSRPHG
jgi:hypothetical protein